MLKKINDNFIETQMKEKKMKKIPRIHFRHFCKVVLKDGHIDTLDKKSDDNYFFQAKKQTKRSEF